MQKLPENDMLYLLRNLSLVVRQKLDSKIFDASEFELAKTSQYLKHIRFNEI